MLLREKDYQRGQSALENKFQNSITDFEILSRRNSCQVFTKTSTFRFSEVLSLCYEKTWTVFDYIEKDTPVFFDDYQKLMNQYEVFERELAQYFTEDLQNSKSFSEMQYFADTEQIYKNRVRLPFSLICKG